MTQLSLDPILALVGWKTSAPRWRGFWRHWVGDGKIADAHWQRELGVYDIEWFGGELRLSFSHEPGSLTMPDLWGLQSIQIKVPTERPATFNGVKLEVLVAECQKRLEQPVAVLTRPNEAYVGSFVSTEAGVEWAVDSRWLCEAGNPKRLKSITIAALGALKLAG